MLVLIKCYGITPRGQHQLYADAGTRGGVTCPHAHITAASGPVPQLCIHGDQDTIYYKWASVKMT